MAREESRKGTDEAPHAPDGAADAPASEAKARKRTRKKVKEAEVQPLNPREIHETGLLLLKFAVFAEGSLVNPGSLGARRVHRVLRDVRDLLKKAESEIPLVDSKDKKGLPGTHFFESDFADAELYQALLPILGDAKANWKKSRVSFDKKALARNLHQAFSVLGRRIIDLSVLEADVELLLQKELFRNRKPTQLVDWILVQRGLRHVRTMQALAAMMERASRSDLVVPTEVLVREMLVWLQAPHEKVVNWARRIWFAIIGGELQYQEGPRRIRFGVRRRIRRPYPLEFAESNSEELDLRLFDELDHDEEDEDPGVES